MKTLTNKTFSRWADWMEKIQNDLQEIVDYQQIYRYFINTVNANLQHINDNQGSVFCDFIRKCYGTYAASGIRRHSKNGDESISLMKLLDQLKKSANQFTYQFHLEQYPLKDDGIEWQKKTFEYFSEDGNSLSEEIIEEDIQTVKDIAGKVSKYVDRAVAHLDKRGIKEDITYKDITDSVDLFNKITCKYIGLITSEGYETLQPSIQGNWKKIFTVPLDIKKYE